MIKSDFLPADYGFVVVVSLKQLLQFALVFKQLPQIGYSNRAYLVCKEALRYVSEVAGQATVLFDRTPEFLNHFLDSFTKGGITVILPAIESVDKRLGGNQIAIRVFSHPAAILLAEEHGAITATSANESGVSPECDTEIAARNLNVPKFVPGTCPNGLGSTFIRLELDESQKRGWRLTVMREGVVPHSDVMRWWTIPA